MDVIVQHTATTWTKRSRGGPAAARRNAVPSAHSLPDELLAAAVPADDRSVTVYVHHVSHHEGLDFAPRSGYGVLAPLRGGAGPAPPRFADHQMSLTVEDSAVRIHVESSGHSHRQRPAVRVRPGERLRWCRNDRYVTSCDGSWWYALDTYHVTIGRVDVATFLGEPTRRVDDLIQLF